MPRQSATPVVVSSRLPVVVKCYRFEILIRRGRRKIVSNRTPTDRCCREIFIFVRKRFIQSALLGAIGTTEDLRTRFENNSKRKRITPAVFTRRNPAIFGVYSSSSRAFGRFSIRSRHTVDVRDDGFGHWGFRRTTVADKTWLFFRIYLLRNGERQRRYSFSPAGRTRLTNRYKRYNNSNNSNNSNIIIVIITTIITVIVIIPTSNGDRHDVILRAPRTRASRKEKTPGAKTGTGAVT